MWLAVLGMVAVVGLLVAAAVVFVVWPSVGAASLAARSRRPGVAAAMAAAKARGVTRVGLDDIRAAAAAIPRGPGPVPGGGVRPGLALLIGSNYRGTSNELHGCIPDVKAARARMLPLGYTVLPLMTDDAGSTNLPTLANMVAALASLRDALIQSPGTRGYFHFSGHGTQVQRDKGDPAAAADPYHEAMVPLDFNTSGFLLDSVYHDTLFKPLPAGVKVFAINDSCHSGTLPNLQFVYDANAGRSLQLTSPCIAPGALLQPTLRAVVYDGGSSLYHSPTGDAVLVAPGAPMPHEAFKSPQGAGRADHHARMGPAAAKYSRGELEMPAAPAGAMEPAVWTVYEPVAADIIVLSACRDSQTAADSATPTGDPVGALSYAVNVVLKRAGGYDLAWGDFLAAVRALMVAGNYSQMPVLSSSKRLAPDARVRDWVFLH